MALLQISEPGQSTAPHQHKLAVGIDLGTTNSLVATVRSGLAKRQLTWLRSMPQRQVIACDEPGAQELAVEALLALARDS